MHKGTITMRFQFYSTSNSSLCDVCTLKASSADLEAARECILAALSLATQHLVPMTNLIEKRCNVGRPRGSMSEKQDTVDSCSSVCLTHLPTQPTAHLLLWGWGGGVGGDCLLSNANYAIWGGSNPAPGHSVSISPSEARFFRQDFLNYN